jgi:hypothetical protein
MFLGFKKGEFFLKMKMLGKINLQHLDGKALLRL